MNSSIRTLPQRPSQTKIVATVGPASESPEMLAALMNAGVDVFRINMAHGDRREHQQRLAAIRHASAATGHTVGVLVDLAGPKIRLGELPGGQFECLPGAAVRFVRGRGLLAPGELSTTYEPLVDELAPGDRVMLADGTVHLRVEQRTDDSVQCRVIQPGVVRSRQGVNLPGVRLSVEALGPADRDNAVWAAENDVDFVGLSFVRSADEVRRLKALLQAHGSAAHVVAKIEKPEAIEQLESIVEAADVVMVARGDLGVEIDIAEVAVVQKQIIATCRRRRKPVIIATQMLDSMQNSRLPTRAEVTDVANAILDGADACMLSGETAIGNYPCEAVEMMHRIALATEPLWSQQALPVEPDLAETTNPITEATVRSAAQLAEQVQAKLIAVVTASGQTALTLSKQRTFVPTLGLSDRPGTLRRMALYWGVIPAPGPPAQRSGELLDRAIAWGREHGLLATGDRLVLVAGTGLKTTAHNMILVHQLD